MKTLLLTAFVAVSFSCNKKEGIWNKLRPDEQAYLTNLARTECLAESKSYFDNLKAASNERFYGPKAYQDDMTFIHTLKDGANIDYYHKLTVWKSSETAIYFLNYIEDSTKEYQFIKVPKATNELMYDALQTKKCANDKTFTVSTSANTYSFVTRSSNSEITQTYTVSADLLAFFSKYKETKSEQPLDTAGKPTGTIKTITGTLAAPALVTGIPQYQSYAEYESNGLNPTLCLINTDVYPPVPKCDKLGTTTFPASEL